MEYLDAINTVVERSESGREGASGGAVLRLDASAIDWVALQFVDAGSNPDPATVSPGRLNVETSRAAARSQLMKLLAQQWKRAAAQLNVTEMDIHQAIVGGAPGLSLMTTGSLVYDTLEELTQYFGTTPKTFRLMLKEDRLGKSESERVIRMARAVAAATDALGDIEGAREYLRTRNFALGGATPLSLLETSAGEQLVLDELQAHADGGPL